MTLGLLVASAVASTAMVWGLSLDAVYAFSPPAAAELGDLRSVRPDALSANTYAHGEGMLGAGGAIRFERSLENDSFRVAPVAGRNDVWVELRVPAGVDPERYVPPSSFTGRLVRFASAGLRHRGLAQSVTALTGQRVPDGAWLLVDGETPPVARWAVVLAILFATFAAWNAVAIVRLVRRVK
jgi:hypothetical protein